MLCFCWQAQYFRGFAACAEELKSDERCRKIATTTSRWPLQGRLHAQGLPTLPFQGLRAGQGLEKPPFQGELEAPRLP